jgi:hypothetical protein
MKMSEELLGKQRELGRKLVQRFLSINPQGMKKTTRGSRFLEFCMIEIDACHPDKGFFVFVDSFRKHQELENKRIAAETEMKVDSF